MWEIVALVAGANLSERSGVASRSGSVFEALSAGLEETRAPTIPTDTIARTGASESRAATIPASRLDDTAAPSSSVAGSATVVSGAPAPLALDDEVVPRRIGRFAVLRRIGRGGMGSVYAAYDEELDRRVAVKVLHVGLDLPPEGRAPIVAEAQAMARLSHAHVVQVYELGEHEGGFFFAMEYVEGETLSAWLREESRAWPEVLQIFLAAGQGLAAAHRAGIVHRDFKPDNVLVDRDGVPRVADFGLARSAAEGSWQVAGTPAYMPPEQLLGGKIDARSDQFSFCVALHVGLYGLAPFGGDDLATLTENVTKGVMRPRPAGTAVPSALHEVLVKGMSTSPSDRFPTMEALLDELRRQVPEEGRSRWSVGLLMTLVASLAVVLYLLTRGAPAGPSLPDLKRVAAEIVRARSAAARTEWVYPSETGDPGKTAIRTILELERVPAPADDYARGKAEALRQIFAEDLAAIGERYWGDTKTRPFARDFYSQVLIFRPDHELALRRSRLTLGQVSDFRERAEEAKFSAEELAAAAPLRVLATTRDPAVIAAIVAAREACVEPVPANTSSSRGRGTAPSEPAPSEPAPSEPTPSEPTPSEPASSEPTPSEPAPSEPASGSAAPERRGAAKARASVRDLSELIEEAENARRRGQDARAAALFREVLADSPREATALAALSDIAFDRGDYREAAVFAEQAAKAAPAIGEHQTRLGDARYKLGDVAAARGAFERAQALGDTRAQRRLALLEKEAR